MGNYFGSSERHDCHNDIELQGNTNDQDYKSECICVKTSEDNCLHGAIKKRDSEKVGEIIRASAGDCLLARNADGEIPLHTACKYNENNGIVKILLGCNAGQGDGINYKQELQLQATNEIFGNTPLHVAACLGNQDIVKTILNYEDSKSLLKKQNKIGDTPVHGAASRGHLSVLKLMYQTSHDCIRYEGRFKGLPLHSACGYGWLEVAMQLLQWDRSTLEYTSVPVILPAFTRTTEPKAIDPKDKENIKKTIEKLRCTEDRDKHDHYTPLTRACQFGHVEIVKHLLENGAVAHPLALIKAIEGLYKKCVEAILKVTYWKDLLHFPYKPDGSLILTTPFRELIKHIPEVAESVLQRCVDLERFLVNSESFKIKLNYEFIDDNGQNWKKETGDEMMTITYTRHHSEETDYDVPPQKDKNIGFNKETHPLSLMVEYKRDKLLTHPVVAALIHDKWKSIYGIFSFMQWLFYVIFVCCTTSLLFKLPNPSSIFCTATEGENNTQLASNASCSSNTTDTDIDCIDVWDPKNDVTVTIIALAIVMLLYSLLRLGLEVIQLLTSLYLACSTLQCRKSLWWDLFGAVKRANYIWDLINWVEVPLFVLSVFFSGVVLSNFKTFCLLAWQWQIGVAVLWLSWIELIFLSTQFQLIGVHALMFIRVLKTIVKFIPLALLLVIAFGLTFHFLLYQPNLMASPYYSPGYSFLKTLSMTAGDIDSDSFFGLDIRGMTHDTSHLQYVQLSTFFWLLSLIFMTILLSNLLIGLAVGDIQTIYAQANIEKLTLQVNYVLTAESQFPKCLRKLGNKSMKEFEPNKASKIETVKKELIYLLWGGIHYDSPESIERLISESSSKK